MALPARGQAAAAGVGAVGMRIDGRTNAARGAASDWAARTWHCPSWAHLRETQFYVRSLERGLTIFDLAPTARWRATSRSGRRILEWLEPVIFPPPLVRQRRECCGTSGTMTRALRRAARTT